MNTWAGKLVGWLLLAAVISFMAPRMACAAPPLPTVDLQPQSQSVLVGSNVMFTAKGSGQGTLLYQWTLNGTNLANNAHISGATSTNLVITGVVAGDAGNYQFSVTDSRGTTFSSNATLTVLFPPSITGHPPSQSVLQGGNATFTVTAGGSAPLDYQWQKNGLSLVDDGHFTGVHTAALVISNVQWLDRDTSYRAIVTNSYGSAESFSGQLTVLFPPTIIQQPANQSARLSSNVTFYALSSGTDPRFYQWYRNGSPLVDDGRIGGATSQTLNLSSVQTDDAGSYQFVATNAYGSATSAVATLTLLLPPTIMAQPTNTSAPLGASATFQVTATGTAPLSYQWQRAGTNLVNNGNYSGVNTAILQILSAQVDDGWSYQDYRVVVSNPYGQAVSSNATLTLLIPPSGFVDPATQSVPLYGTATFYVFLNGTPPFTYQWRKNNVDLPDDPRYSVDQYGSLTISPVLESDWGSYGLILSNPYGSITISGGGQLNVLMPPFFTAQPQSQTIPAGSNVTFSASAANAGPLTTIYYQWRLNGTNLPGATSTSLTITNAQAWHGGDYTVRAQNNGGAVTSSVAQLTVNASVPWFITPPQSQGVPVGKTVVFSATARGTDPLGYQWRFQSQPIPGATATNLIITNAQSAASGLYELVVTNAIGSLTGAVSLAVQDPAIIIRQPANLAVFAGSNISFNATGVGTAIGWQWHFNGSPLTDAGRVSGSTTPNLNIANVQPGDAGTYFVRATNAWSTATSRTAAVMLLDGLAQSVRYVNLSNSTPAAPYLDWATAATNIQDAIDVAVSGDTILVTNGVYSSGGRTVYGISTNRVTVDKAVILKSVNGPEYTVIQGSKIPTLAGTRCVYLTNGASLIGFTLTNGATPTRTGDTFRDLSGAGVWCEDTSAIISNCIITGCRGYSYAGGAYQGTLFNCALTNNQTGDAKLGDGGGVYAGVVYRSALIGNVGTSGGGACASTLIDCLLTKNSGYAKGGGASDSTLIGCTVISNQLYTQIFFAPGGGVYGGSLLNSIICSNAAIIAPNWTNSFVAHSCLTPAPTTGFGNFTNPPSFANLPGGNLRLLPDSPCINSGNNTFVASDTDKDGNPRIVGGTVDVGAYEYQTPASTLSYAWAQQYGLPTDGTADYADSDGDSLNNWQEWKSGTVPINGVSVLKMASATNSVSGLVVTWQSVSGISYYLQRSSDLAGGFTSIASNLVGQAGSTSFPDTTATNAGPYFYRVGVP